MFIYIFNRPTAADGAFPAIVANLNDKFIRVQDCLSSPSFARGRAIFEVTRAFASSGHEIALERAKRFRGAGVIHAGDALRALHDQTSETIRESSGATGEVEDFGHGGKYARIIGQPGTYT